MKLLCKSILLWTFLLGGASYGADASKIATMVVSQKTIKAIGFSGWQDYAGPFAIIGTTTTDKSVRVFVRTPDNSWLAVDCASLDNGGGICFSASLIYTGFVNTHL
jgi:hypothetical protein